MDAASLTYFVLSNVLGGSSYIATEYALRGFSPGALTFWRMLLGSLAMLPILYARRDKLKLSRGDWGRIAAVGAFGYAAPLYLGTLGLEQSSATKAALLIGVEPVGVALLSALFLGEAVGARKVLGIGAGLAGGALIVLQGAPAVGREASPDFWGDVLLFMHGLGWALYSVIGKPVLRRVDPLTFTALTTLLALPPTALLCGPALLRPAPAPDAGSVAILLYLTAGVTVAACWCWNKALERVPASTLASFIFLQPLVGVLLGVLFRGESLSPWSLAGGALILAGATASAWEPGPTQLALGAGGAPS